MTDLIPTDGSGPNGPPCTITPSSDQWPEFAPAWAATAVLEAHGDVVTFMHEWSIPSMYRGTEPLLVIRIEQDITFSGANAPLACGEQRITAGPPALWADYRHAEIASTLRAIADALAPLEITVGAEYGKGEV